MIRYFVSYRFEKIGTPGGYGRCEFVRQTPIVSIKDIEQIEEMIRNDCLIKPDKVFVQFWQRFEVEE